MPVRAIDPYLPHFLLDKIATQSISSRADAIALSTVNKRFLAVARPYIWNQVSFSPDRPPSSFVTLYTHADICESTFEIEVSGQLPDEEYDPLVHILDCVRDEHAHSLIILHLSDMDLSEIPIAVLMGMVTGVGEVHLFNCSCSSMTISKLVTCAGEMHNFGLHAAKFGTSTLHEIAPPPSLIRCTFLPSTPADESLALPWLPYVLFRAPIMHLTICVFSERALRCLTHFQHTLRYLSVAVNINRPAPFRTISLSGFNFLTTIKVDCVPCDFLYPERNIVAWAVGAPCLHTLFIRAYAEYFEAECWDALPSILGGAENLSSVNVCFLIRRISHFKPAAISVAEAIARVQNALYSDTNQYTLKTRAILARPVDSLYT